MLLYYFGLQFLSLNLCILLGCVLYDPLPRYVDAILLVVIVPVASGFIVGHYAGEGFADYESQHNLCTANGLIGILAAVAVGMCVLGGGRQMVRMMYLRTVTDVTPEQSANEKRVGYFVFSNARLLREHKYDLTVTSRTTHRTHDGQSSTLRHTDFHTVVPVVGPDYEKGDPVSVWLGCWSRVTIGRDGFRRESSKGDLAIFGDDTTISGEVIRDPLFISKYRAAANAALNEHGLKETPRVHFILPTTDPQSAQAQHRFRALLTLVLANVLLVLLPTGIYRFVSWQDMSLFRH
jgi:hypothetical protein